MRPSGAKDSAARGTQARSAGAKDSTAPRGLTDAVALRQAERTAAARTGAKTRAKTGIAAAPEILRPAKVRLQKALAAAGVTSRRKAEELIAAGAIKVNGKRVTELGSKVDPDRDVIEVRGSRVQLEKKVYFLLNKPDGVVCSAEGPKDNEGRPTVLSLFPELPQRIYPVGRLDFHTRGALILTNDGDLAAALTHPRHEIPKTYHVKFQGKLTEAELGTLATGVTLEDGTVTRPAAEVSVIKDTSTNSWVQITLRQGLNRQIRRMGEAIGRPVLKLIRVAIGDVTADGLADGEFRPLTPTEVYDLMAAASPAAHPGAKARPRVGGQDSTSDAGGRARSRLAPRKRAG
ncbi:pseudouridine synthase [Nannocystis pusilla]|uniref:Pseudouridine synthase n=1 Tax=Nannocystis pusilla TaxID=889268 RepID=A0A9X3ENG3_9BACT|nr:pseudouridine synthase [Nannocystis pusilla]